MVKRAKPNADRTRGNVIALPVGRADASGSVPARDAERLASQPAGDHVDSTPSAADGARGAAAHFDHHEDDSSVRDFFANPGGQHVHESWDDLPEADPHGGTHRRGMFWTAGIAGGGLLAIGAFLLYHKVLMPTPEELGRGEVALPTPDMIHTQPAEEPAAPAPTEPTPEEPSAQAPSEPAPSAATPGAQAAEPAADQPAATQPAKAVPAPQASPAGEYGARLAEARKLGFKRTAEAAYQQALAAKPGASEALSGLAMLYLNQGKTLAARDRAREALESDANSAEALIVLGAAESAVGNQAAARDAYTRCASQPAGSSRYVLECKRMLR